MIHIVTAANRSLYRDQLREMHQLRWLYFIEQRDWRELRDKQTEPGFERDEYDDERAVYLLALSQTGAVQGSMRLRPTDDKSLLWDHFSSLVDPDANPPKGARVWEITRAMRAPAYRGSEGEQRLAITCAACEFALGRGIKSYVAVVDTFLLPAMRALNRDKHQVLGLPQDHAGDEIVAVALKPDFEWLAMCRKRAGFTQPLMLELPPPPDMPSLRPEHEALLAGALRGLAPADLPRILPVLARAQPLEAQAG